MSTRITRLAILGLVSILNIPIHAADEGTVVISSGRTGGGYWNAGERLAQVADGVGLDTEVVQSDGSLDNLRRLSDPKSPVSVALAQADALQFFLRSEPDLLDRVEVLENIGQECVFMVASATSALRSDADLQRGQNYKIAISSPTSGTAVTYAYMNTLVPDLAGTQVVYMDPARAILELGQDGGVDAIMQVQRPKAQIPEVESALENPDRYRLLAVRDDRLQQSLPNGENVYHALNLALPGARSGQSARLETICVKGLLLANREKITPEARAKLSDIINYHWMKVYALDPSR